VDSVDTVRVWSSVHPILLGRKCDATHFTDKGMLLHYYSALCCQIWMPKDERCGVRGRERYVGTPSCLYASIRFDLLLIVLSTLTGTGGSGLVKRSTSTITTAWHWGRWSHAFLKCDGSVISSMEREGCWKRREKKTNRFHDEQCAIVCIQNRK
jgi:hypothetical protein